MKPDKKIEDIVKKLRNERKEAVAECRYEIVNCSRGLKDQNTDQEDAYDLVDLETKTLSESQAAQYTYDLYTAARQNFDVFDEDNLVWLVNYFALSTTFPAASFISGVCPIYTAAANGIRALSSEKYFLLLI